MTEQNLLTELGKKFNIVLTPKQGVTEGDITHWSIPVMNKTETEITRQWVHYYIDNSDEKAYWQDREPAKTVEPVITFRSEVQTYLNTEIGKGIFLGGIITVCDEANKTAIIDVLTVSGEDALKGQVFVNKDGEAIQHKTIV